MPTPRKAAASADTTKPVGAKAAPAAAVPPAAPAPAGAPATETVGPLYRGTKELRAQPMTRGDYNTYRGWQVPADENPEDAGFLVEYADGGEPNDDRHAGYISWSPTAVFERAYKPVDEADEVDAMPVAALQDKYRDLSRQIDALADTILELDIRGTENEGACGIAMIRLREAYGKKAGAEDDHLVNAHEFAAAARDHLDHVTRTANREAYEAATLNIVESFAKLPEHADLSLRLANGSEFLDGALTVTRDQLAPQGERGIYMRPIDIPPEGPPVRATEAFLIASNGDCVRCEIGAGLTGGGGHHALIPAGNLLF